jgi:glycosyltransferase involved in cell wall biosynthesis
MTKTIAIIGSHGLYANYGGWDELVNNLAERKPEDTHYIVFNSADAPPHKQIPEGITVRQLKLRADGYQGILYDFWSIFESYWKVDAILLLGVQGIPIVPFLRLFKKVRIVSNVGGIEWLRPKFGFLQKQYLKWCFNLSMVYSSIVILDNSYHLDFVPKKIKAKVKVLPYGGEIDTSLEITEELEQKYPFIRSDYFLSVSRVLEDNQIAPLCESFVNSKYMLVLISNLSTSQYGKQILQDYGNLPNIVLIDGLYIKPELDLVRRHCKAYIHTHTLCGTAPSLVEMMIAQRPLISIDNPQNRFTLQGEGYLFTSFPQVHQLLNRGEDLSRYIASREVCDRYSWQRVVKEYESCFNPLNIQ